MMRFCPSCATERPVDEFLCEGEVEGRPCGWELSGQPIRAEGWRPGEVTPADAAIDQLRCVNGHDVAPGDLLCAECGGDVALEAPSATPDADRTGSSPERPASADEQAQGLETEVAAWRLLRRLPTTSHVRERYETIRDEDGRAAVLTLYANGSEPDPEVYEVLRTSSVTS
jgi:hypothetical protein